MTTRADVIACARQWLRTPWRHQGRVRGVGTDCLGLIGGVALELGLPGAAEWHANKALRGYGRDPVPEMLLDASDRYLDRIPIHEAREADILVMTFHKLPQHFGILSRTDPRYMIHAYAQRREVIETQTDIPNAKIVRAYSYRGLND